jgi:hypothetical protein
MQYAISGILVYAGPHGVSGIIESIIFAELQKPFVKPNDYEDLRQEMRMAAIAAMPKYNSNRIGPSPYSYLRQCVRNHMYNQSRGVDVPNNPPCTRCPLWDKVQRTCIISEVGCEAILRYRKNMKTKAAIRRPDHLGDTDVSIGGTDISDLQAFILDDLIINRLPVELIPFYRKLLLGQHVDATNKTKLRLLIKEIIDGEA